MKKRIGIVVNGAAGRMGRRVLAHVLGDSGLVLRGAIEQAGHRAVGRSAAALVGGDGGDDAGVIVQAAGGEIPPAEAVIDFTRPEASLALAKALRGTALITGTTGWTAAQKRQLAHYARDRVIVAAPNMSAGVVALGWLARQAGRMLDETYDAEIQEWHHRHKRDAPSGTALALAEVLGRTVEAEADRGGERRPGTVGFAVSRGGDVIGDHSVVFAGNGERIELTHRASSRDIYVHGALRAARWTVGRPPGLYSMEDVLTPPKS